MRGDPISPRRGPNAFPGGNFGIIPDGILGSSRAEFRDHPGRNFGFIRGEFRVHPGLEFWVHPGRNFKIIPGGNSGSSQGEIRVHPGRNFEFFRGNFGGVPAVGHSLPVRGRCGRALPPLCGAPAAGGRARPCL